MKNKKAIIFFALIAVFAAAVFTSCKTTVPVSASTAFPENCTILGRVTITTDVQKSGYIKLLEAAKKQYPGCDDVVNIIVDAERGILKSSFTMSGIAIKFN